MASTPSTTPLPTPSTNTTSTHISTPPPSLLSQTSQNPTSASELTFTLSSLTSFPPLYTLQPNLATRARQLEIWSSLITIYCRTNSLFRLSLSNPPADLFSKRIGLPTHPSVPAQTELRTLKSADIRTVLEHMSRPENGSKIEWIPASSRGEQSAECWVWWRSAGEWAEMLYAWVEETGQKGAVLTLYELREGDAVRGREWRVMDEGMLRRVLGVLVKKGKAQLFGQESGGEGVKFF